MKKLLLTILFILPIISFAQIEGKLVIGDMTVLYDAKTTTDSGTYYYKEEDLVASEYEGISIVYEFDSAVLEAHDTDGDGVLDAFLRLDKFNEIESAEGEGAKVFERPEPVDFVDLVAEQDGSEASVPEDLVGDLSEIKIPKYHNYKLYGFVIILIGGGYWWYRRKRIINKD